MRAAAEQQAEEAEKIVRDIRRATRRHYAAGGYRSRKVCSSILGRGLTTRALVRGVAQPARAKNKPMLVDANTARRQKFNTMRHLGGGGGELDPAARGVPVETSRCSGPFS